MSELIEYRLGIQGLSRRLDAVEGVMDSFKEHGRFISDFIINHTNKGTSGRYKTERVLTDVDVVVLGAFFYEWPDDLNFNELMGLLAQGVLNGFEFKGIVDQSYVNDDMSFLTNVLSSLKIDIMKLQK